MSQHEKFAWGSLFASVLAWLFLTMRMTESWLVVDASPRHMIWTYGAVVILMIVAHAVLSGLVYARTGGGSQKDERDLAIAARAEHIEGIVVLVAVNLLVIHALAYAALSQYFLPSIDLGTLPVLFYALLTVLFLGHISSQAVIIWLYRA
jgi:magnesium-transporting ATPase (P-type)